MVCPVIDVIDWNTFEYLGNSGEPQIGGFDWRLVFTWHVVPERERLRMRSPTDVIRSGVCLVVSGQHDREDPWEGCQLLPPSPFLFQSVSLFLLKITATHMDFMLVYICLFTLKIVVQYA